MDVVSANHRNIYWQDLSAISLCDECKKKGAPQGSIMVDRTKIMHRASYFGEQSLRLKKASYREALLVGEDMSYLNKFELSLIFLLLSMLFQK